ncbi:MAG: starch-binding protein, partial [Eubacteriales bacterium]|nr:starch-binding protein [Eubacteriales bacterium]
MKRMHKLISLLLVVMLMASCVITALSVSAAGDTVYVKVNSSYGTPNCYMWNGQGGEGNQNAAWPGAPMTSVGNGVYSYTPDVSYANVIFSGNGGQTKDLAYPGANMIYIMDSDSWQAYDPTQSEPDVPTEPVTPTTPQGPVTPPGGGTVSGSLDGYFSTNPNNQVGVNKTISIDGAISDWDSSMLIAQGVANDDPRVYRPNSMYEVGVDLYALYAAYDDNNLYLMWEMTNVQDKVAPNDDYPLSQGTLFETQEFPFFIAVDTRKADTAIGNKGALTTGGTIWNSGMTFANSFNKLISINTKGGNGPWVYGGNSAGLNAKEILTPGTSKVTMNFGKGILSKNVYGIDKAYGHYNNRVPGDVVDSSAAWVDFNAINHNSSKYDFFYELSIPYNELEITKSDIENNGIGVMLVATMGMSAMDCLPGDLVMTDNAHLDDAAHSQENNSFEKSDEDYITVPFASIGKIGSGVVVPPVTEPSEPTDPAIVPSEPASVPSEPSSAP